MIETGRHRQTWLPPEQRLCSHCDLNQMETELHFLTECSKYTDIRTVYYDKYQQIHPTFTTLPDQEKLAYLLGEHKTCCVFAAQYVSLCHHRREDTPPEREERERERREKREEERRERERLAIETGRHRKSWLPREQRVCVHCETGEIETETHFLRHCHKYIFIRNLYFSPTSKITLKPLVKQN